MVFKYIYQPSFSIKFIFPKIIYIFFDGFITNSNVHKIYILSLLCYNSHAQYLTNVDIGQNCLLDILQRTEKTVKIFPL